MKKTFEIDWDNYEELSALGNKLKSRLGEINPNRVSKKERIRNELDLCRKILESDIRHAYSNLQLDREPNYYVYAHLDTTRKVAIGRASKTTFAATLGMEYFPFYIGKGTGNRYNDINRNETHRKIRAKIESAGKEIKVVKVFGGLSELDALCYESKLIDIFGLVPYRGLLTNLDEGINKDIRRLSYRKELEELNNIHRIL